MEADISIWRKTGHFYFALTTDGLPIGLPMGWTNGLDRRLSLVTAGEFALHANTRGTTRANEISERDEQL